MNVIAHQHIGIEPVAKSLLARFEQILIAVMISIVFEDCLTLIAATHDVIERPGEMYPWFSGHLCCNHNLQNSK
jgi:hypothetical protein